MTFTRLSSDVAFKVGNTLGRLYPDLDISFDATVQVFPNEAQELIPFVGIYLAVPGVNVADGEVIYGCPIISAFALTQERIDAVVIKTMDVLAAKRESMLAEARLAEANGAATDAGLIRATTPTPPPADPLPPVESLFFDGLPVEDAPADFEVVGEIPVS